MYYKLVADRLLHCLQDSVSAIKCAIGAKNGIASLDSTGNVPADQLANAGGGGGSVSSVFGRTGTVVASSGDYTFAEIGSTPTTLAGYGITNGQTTLSVTTTGTSGTSTLISSVLNIPQYQQALTLSTTGTTGAATLTSGTLTIPQYQGALSLTTTGSSGAATLSGNTLNIPQYTTTQFVSSLTTTGTSGAATVTTGVLNIPQYVASTGANPSASLGLTAVNGSATTFLRSDGAPALSQAIAPTWTSLHTHSFPSLGTTVTPAVTLINTSTSSSGAQQISPALHFQGQGWETSTSASQPVDSWIYQLPVQGSTVAGSSLVFAMSQNTGSVTNVLVLNDGGGATLTGSLTASANCFIGSSSGFTWGTGGTTPGLYSDSTYEMSIRQGTHACQMQIYNTYTSSSVFEAGVFGFQTNANLLNIGTITTGGTLRNTQFVGGTVNMIATAVKRTTVADAAYSVLATDYLIAYTTLTAARTVTLPTAVGATGQQYIIKDEVGSAGTDNITIATTSSQLIDGSSTKVINTAYGVIRVYSNGSNYFTW